jgi:hypothetical protein
MARWRSVVSWNATTAPTTVSPSRSGVLTDSTGSGRPSLRQQLVQPTDLDGGGDRQDSVGRTQGWIGHIDGGFPGDAPHLVITDRKVLALHDALKPRAWRLTGWPREGEGTARHIAVGGDDREVGVARIPVPEIGETCVTGMGIAAQDFRQLGDGDEQLAFGLDQTLLIGGCRAHELQRLVPGLYKRLLPLLKAHIEGEAEPWEHCEGDQHQEASLQARIQRGKPPA